MGIVVSLLGLAWSVVGFWGALSIANPADHQPSEAQLLGAAVYGVIGMLGLVLWGVGLIIRRLPPPGRSMVKWLFTPAVPAASEGDERRGGSGRTPY